MLEDDVFIHTPLVNEGTAIHSERATRMFAKAINCSVFDVRCLDDKSGTCTFNERKISLDEIARVIPKLRHRNAHNSGVFIRPCGPFVLADDAQDGTLERMLDDNLRIAAVIETSPGSFQVWVPLAGPLQTIDPAVCVAACERLEELYGTDPGVLHRDSFGRAPGFRNRKPKHDRDGEFPLVRMLNRHSGFRGYDRALLEEANRMVNSSQHPGKRSAGAVLTNHSDPTNRADDDHGAIKVFQNGEHVVTFSPISADRLYQQFLDEMISTGYVLPQRSSGVGEDRSQCDLDILRWMHNMGVPCHVAQAALEAASDKAQKRREPYIQHLISTVWGQL
jgi:hypothetical protein